MENESRMKQHYAVSSEGVLVHIKIAHESNEDYFCPHCRCRMIKKCGNHNAWHFAHDYRYYNQEEHNCSYESYLHAYAKLRIKEWFENSRSIVFHYTERKECPNTKLCVWRKHTGETCGNEIEKTFDLKKCLDACDLEASTKVNGEIYRADLLCYKSKSKENNKILFEIKVSHECTEQKKHSSAKIVEFEIHSEEDVDAIIGSQEIKESDTVKYYGIFDKPQKDINYPAKYKISKFVLYKNGSAYPNSICTCRDYLNMRKSAVLEISSRVFDNDFEGNILQTLEGNQIENGRFFNWGLSYGLLKGLTVRNCYICPYHKYDFDNKVLLCEKGLNSIGRGIAAKNCHEFIPDTEKSQKYYEEFQNIRRYIEIDIHENLSLCKWL